MMMMMIMLVMTMMTMMMMMMVMMYLKNREEVCKVISIGNTIVSIRLFYPRREGVWPEVLMIFQLKILLMMVVGLF